MALLVAAIDFGTTYSGWAFSFRHEFVKDPAIAQTKNWCGPSIVSSKAPTSVLIKEGCDKAEAFGYEAESKYSEYAEQNCHKEYYLFTRFKMELYGRIGVERNMKIKDLTGKELAASTVFALAIKHLRDDLLEMSKQRLTAEGLLESEIQWVLTVPAIWNDAAKQFMREAAQKAGIHSERLIIALEPEAASIYCRHIPVDKDGGSFGSLKNGSKYLVLDAGGGTVDVTVHQVSTEGYLKELYKASGGCWGGTKVDEAYCTFLNSIPGCDIIESLKQDYMEDYIAFMSDFEIKKRTIKPNDTSTVIFRLPFCLSSLLQKKTEWSNDKTHTNAENRNILERGKLRVDAEVAKNLFKEPVQNIADHVETILKKPNVEDCSAILMVGGFSESKMLQQKIRDQFPDKNIIIPREAGLTVLKGALIFGHNPAAISERVCRTTYGVKMTHRKSDNCNHPPGRVEIDKNGDLRCYDIFECHVKEGTTVRVGEKQPELTSNPVYDEQSSIITQIFVSSSPDVNFTTEDCCKKIGELSVNIPDTSLGRKRSYGTSFIFSEPEIRVIVEDKATGEIISKTVNFLN